VTAMEAPQDAGDAEGIVFAIDPVSDAAEAAVAAARRLVTALLDAERVPADEMDRIASELGGIADRIESRVPARERPAGPRGYATRPREEAALRNPVNGRQNALAPGLRMRGLPDGSVAGDVTLGQPYEGPPGYVHGGISALLLDHLFGAANFWAGAVGPTAELTLRYRRPTPLFTPLRLRARQESADGRKLRTTGTIEAGGKVCVEAEGLFIAKQNFGVRP
jgi:acyl-coenzyme A thioesterase PaaI-like protein